MFEAVCVVLMLFVPQAGTSAALPDTPQGKHLRAYIDAFNTGDEKKYLAMMEEHMEPGLLKRRPVEERAKMFQRMRGDFGTLTVSQVINASADQIQLGIPDKEGTIATFTFRFEATMPFRISSMSVEIDHGG